MDAQQFLAEFGHIANAPGGVARLRELILALAVQGRLVEQLESAESADAQVEKIRRAASVRPTTGRRKEASALSANSFLPMAAGTLPKGWANVPLCALVRVLNGRAYSKQELLNSGTPVLRVGNLFTSDKWYYSNLELEDDKYCDNGDLLYAWSASFGPFIWSGEKVIYHYHIWKLDLFSSTDLNKHYLYTYLLEKTQEIKAAGHGISMAHMTKERFEQLSVLLPPLEEQSRIVAKIDELMSLCDKLEDEQQKRRKLQNTLRQATLQAVAKAQSPHELQANWARLEANFGRLFSAPEDVDEVIGELKNLAVRGLLAEGIANDLDIEKVKSDCQALRDQYNASGLMRKQKLVAMAEPETSYPSHWVTEAFDEVAIVIGGVTKGRDLRGRETLTCQYLSVANVQRGYFKLDELKTIQIAKDELEKYKVAEGDLLITEGGDWDKVGRTAIWPGGIDDCLHQNHVFKARVPSDLLLNEWVELVFNSGIGRDYFAGASKQTTNLASINMTQLRSFPLPIPPTAEQKAILSRLSELTLLCVEWRKLIVRRQQMGSLLAQATVASLTGIDLVSEEEAVKVPQTELISRLRLGQAPSVKDQAPLASILARHSGELATQELWQRSTLEIDAFYAQLKTEVAHGWIEEPAVAEVREKPSERLEA